MKLIHIFTVSTKKEKRTKKERNGCGYSINSFCPTKRTHPIGILKFDREVIEMTAMSQNLRARIDNLLAECDELGNDFSAKLLSNREMLPLIEYYAKILRNYNFAGQEFARLAGLEKIITVKDDIEELVSDLKKKFDELTPDFQMNFDEARLYISEVLAPAIERLIEVGKEMHVRAQDILISSSLPKSTSLNLLYKFFNGISLLIFGIALGFFIRGIASNRADWVMFGSIMILSAFMLAALLKLEKKSDQMFQRL